MAQETEPLDRAHSAERPEIRVVRDNTFFRACVDHAYVIPLGRDLEISCVQGGPQIDSLTDFDDRQQLNFAAVLNEVARLRIGWREAVGLAVQILDAGMNLGHIKRDQIIETIIKNFPDAETAGSSEAGNGK